jgi:hypothetical protein
MKCQVVHANGVAEHRDVNLARAKAKILIRLRQSQSRAHW